MAEENDEEVACPVCGKAVGVDVSSCPYCGAEFEEDEIEEEIEAPKAKPAASDEDEEVACPVCGMMVGVDVISCPKCGAEFEEEEIEEVIEVEERTVIEAAPEPARSKPKASARPTRPARAEERPKPKPKAKPRVTRVEEPSPMADLPSSIMDFRVIGVALILLGIIGVQIALMIDWYWSWVPPIEDNMVMFIVLPVVLLVVGLLAFMLVKKAMSSGREMPSSMPGVSLSLFLFGILALIVIVLWDPINSAMQDSREMVAGAFAVALVLGILLLVMGMRRSSDKAACD